MQTVSINQHAQWKRQFECHYFITFRYSHITRTLHRCQHQRTKKQELVFFHRQGRNWYGPSSNNPGYIYPGPYAARTCRSQTCKTHNILQTDTSRNTVSESLMFLVVTIMLPTSQSELALPSTEAGCRIVSLCSLDAEQSA